MLGIKMATNTNIEVNFKFCIIKTINTMDFCNNLKKYP